MLLRTDPAANGTRLSRLGLLHSIERGRVDGGDQSNRWCCIVGTCAIRRLRGCAISWSNLVAKVDFMRVNTNPFGSQAPCEIVSNAGGDHRNYDEIQAGPEAECCRGNPGVGQGETTENPTPVPNASSNKDSAAEATPPARTAVQEIGETSDSAVPSLSSDVRTSAMRVSLFSSSDISPDFGSKSNKSK
jgi:hypothetical protein